MQDRSNKPLIVANCSGFLGDRPGAAREQLDGGDIDVLCGDYLAELTMVILQRQMARNPEAGYCRPFVTELKDVLIDCLDRGVKIVANAGGVNPESCRQAIIALAKANDRSVRVAVVAGDRLTERFSGTDAPVVRDFSTNSVIKDPADGLLCAHAYLGARGVARALAGGADVVITGRVVDAAVVLGPAAWHFGWAWDDWDRLAAGITAGHLLECGSQVTGGNYCCMAELEDWRPMAFPIAEIRENGDFDITIHDDQPGNVSIGTVTAQLLYEIQGPVYVTPDVCARFDSVRIDQAGPNRVHISGIRGLPSPPDLKVSLHYEQGYRNSVNFFIGPGQQEEKIRIVEDQFWHNVGGHGGFVETERDVFVNQETGVAHLRLAARSSDEAKIGRSFSNAAIHLALASVPGITFDAPPAGARPCLATRPGLVRRVDVNTVVLHADGSVEEIAFADGGGGQAEDNFTGPIVQTDEPTGSWGEMVQSRLADFAGARSGDKGGNANIGLWTDRKDRYEWLREHLDSDALRVLLPRPFDGQIKRFEFPLIKAFNFVLVGYLGDGGFANTQIDNQAKYLSEQVRYATLNVPRELV